MRVVEGCSDLPQDGEFHLHGHIRVMPHPALKVHAGHKIHDKIEVSGRFVLVQGTGPGDVLMVQVADDLVVGTNLLHLALVVAHLWRKPLHGHLHAAHQVETLIDDPHPAFSELTLHHVTLSNHVAPEEPL